MLDGMATQMQLANKFPISSTDPPAEQEDDNRQEQQAPLQHDEDEEAQNPEREQLDMRR